MLFVNRRTRNTGAELPVELGTRPGPVTKICYRWVCERPLDLLLNLGTRFGVTIYIYPAEPMAIACAKICGARRNDSSALVQAARAQELNREQVRCVRRYGHHF